MKRFFTLLLFVALCGSPAFALNAPAPTQIAAGAPTLTGTFAGQVAVPVGATSQTVLFAPTLGGNFATSCTAVVPALVPPKGGGDIDCSLTELPSKTGFSVRFGAPMQTSGYVLVFIASGK